jgi:formiminoglutamase
MALPSMESVTPSPDSNWPSAATLLSSSPVTKRRNVALLGIPTYATSVTPRSSKSAPAAIRSALERYSTWSFSDQVDLAESLCLVDYGDVVEPDSEGGIERVAAAINGIDQSVELRIVLGGDNAASWHALRTLAADDLANWGLITLDAHLDLRDGRSNGSPVRQLLEEGLDGHHVVQVGLADFSNSAFYAQVAHDAGITVIPRETLRQQSIEDVATHALVVAGAGGRPVYVDIDLDVADRSVVPGCPAAAPGGLTADEMRRFVRVITHAEHVRAIDFTEIDVALDTPDQRTVRLAALLLLEALSGLLRRQ